MGRDWRDIYGWLAAWAVICHSLDDDDPPPLAMSWISAVAGQLRRQPGGATNGPAAAVLILMLFWWQFYAKTRAKLPGSSSVSRKLHGAAILAPIPFNPAWLLTFALRWLGAWQCQNDHLPTCRQIRKV